MNFLDFFSKAITSPVVSVIGFVLSLYVVYIAVDFIRKGLKNRTNNFNR